MLEMYFNDTPLEHDYTPKYLDITILSYRTLPYKQHLSSTAANVCTKITI